MISLGMIGGGGILTVLFIIGCIFLLPIIAIISIIKNNFPNRVLWLLLVLFFPFLGALIYLLIKPYNGNSII